MTEQDKRSFGENENLRKKPPIGLIMAYITVVLGASCIALAVSIFTISGIEKLFFSANCTSPERQQYKPV
jgi:hypothetical protein